MMGCHEARNAVTIVEVVCPSCSEAMEVLVRDGVLCTDSVCPECSNTLVQGTFIGELQCV